MEMRTAKLDDLIAELKIYKPILSEMLNKINTKDEFVNRSC